MGLPSSVVDVFLSTMNQVPGKHSGVPGRLTELIDCQVRKYVGPGQDNERVVAEARWAFQQLASTSRTAEDGTSTAVDWQVPEMLGPLGDQLVSVCKTTPRVYADDTSTWSAYPDVRVLTDRLDEDVYHTSDHTIQVPDGAQVGDSTGMVWTETGYTQDGEPIGSTWFGIRSVLGTWVTSPRQLYAPASSSIRTMAKVVSDGTSFWVFWNDEASGFGINVAVYNEQGLQLATLRVTQTWQNTPGFWDITYQQGKVLLAQPGGYNPPNDVNVNLTSFAYSSGTITPTSNIDVSMHCNGGVAWLTNDADPTRAYLATLNKGTPDNFFQVLAYQVNASTLAATHSYDSGLNLPAQPDSLTGWTASNGSGGFDLNLAYSMLSWQARLFGPTYDPALRNLNTIFVPFTGSPSAVRTTQSVIAVSRAFARDGKYYVYSYYQSGSGLVLTTTPLDVTIVTGDYMIGNGSQSIPVSVGDYTTGGPVGGHAGTFIVTTTGLASQSVVGTDSVALYTVTAGDPLNTGPGAVPVGSVVLSWIFLNIAGPGQPYGMSYLSCAGTSISGANSGNFLILPMAAGAPGNTIYTQTTSSTGTSPVPGTFAASGSFTIQSAALYPISSLGAYIGQDVAFMYPGGNLTISSASGSGNNATFLCESVQLDNSLPVNDPKWCNKLVGPALAAIKTTQTTSPSVGFDWSQSPQLPFSWFFAKFSSDASYDGTILNVSGAGAANDGGFTVTGHAGGRFQTTGTDASVTVAQVFSSPLPTVTVDIPLSQTPYTFFLQGVTTNYTYLNAFLSISGDTQEPVNNGTYKITWLDPTNTSKFVATPVDGKTDQVNQAFNSDSPPTIVIQFQNGQQPEFQPCWFITPLDGNWPQVGCFERGIAYADWRFEGEQTYPGPNTYPLGLSSPFFAEGVPAVILPYRAKSFTAGETVTTPSGTATSLVTDTLESTVGLKRFRLFANDGLPTQAFNEQVLPGPLGGGFTSSGFHEQGVNLGPECPFLVEQDHDTSVIGVTAQEIQIRVTYEWMDDNGERGYSYPSPPLIFNLQAPNNVYTIGGRLPLPLSSTGGNVPSVFGITNRRLVSICLYRTAVIDGIPTTQLYKITNDLNPNGLYSGVGVGSGFTFPDTYTWYYRDRSLDASIIDAEALYTSRGQLPRWPAPPNSRGDVWENRTWLVGYDKAVWCSGDKAKGDSNWFFPGFRLTIGDDVPVDVARMEQYLVIGGKSRMWYIPAQSLPSNTGSSGSLPTPSPLPFPNGCTGFMATLNSGTAYSSTAGGVWIVTRDLKNLWLSEQIKDDLGTVTGMAVDQDQRLAVADGSANLYVYDTVATAWYRWRMPSNVIRLCTWQGRFAYEDTSGVLRQVPGAYLDTYSGGNHAIAPDLTFAGISFAQARAVKLVREMQLVGEYKGPHRLNAVISYPDDYGLSPTSFGPYTPDPDKAYLIAINPRIEEAGQYGLRVFASFEGITTPGNSFTLELISCDVALDKRQGVFGLPQAQRVRAN